ncbi:MAG: glycosyltransferase family 1 protein [Planctomycetes bacterium]|nr:glycosyltransferase family 1 protein [Planctomycetota bacterium]
MPRQLLLYSDAPVFGGAERALIELARELPRAHWEVTVVLSEEGAVDPLAQLMAALHVRVVRLPAIPTLKARGAFLKVWRFFVQNRFDVVHFNLTDPRACTGAMTAAGMALRSDFVVTEHLPRSVFDNMPLPRRVRSAAARTAHTITNTEADRSAILARPWNSSQVHVVANGVTDDGVLDPERRTRARAELGFPSEHFLLVGLVGRLIPQKNPDLFLEGVRRVVPHFPQARFVVLGDGPLLAPMRAKAEELGIAQAMCWYGFRNDARELLRGLDLLVNTSVVEGMPFSVIEAMFAGLPVIGTRIPGLLETVADHASGVLVPPGDGEILGGAMCAALSDRARLHRFGLVGRERAQLLFHARGMAARIASIYELPAAVESAHA